MLKSVGVGVYSNWSHLLLEVLQSIFFRSSIIKLVATVSCNQMGSYVNTQYSYVLQMVFILNT